MVDFPKNPPYPLFQRGGVMAVGVSGDLIKKGFFMLKYNHLLKQNAHRLRIQMTEVEKQLWSRLRRKQIQEVQFYRQKPIGNYIVDFYAPKAKLVIELDGSQHLEVANQYKDAKRDAYLQALGLQVLRFNNLQVLQEIDAVMEVIFRKVTEQLKKIPPNPPFSKGGT